MKGTLEYALKYLGKGWGVIPLKGSGTNPNAPALKEWNQYIHKLPTKESVTRWFSNEQFGVGVVCGEVSGIVVLDLDLDHGPNCAELAKSKYGIDVHNDPNIVKTGDGYHVYFKCPPVEVKNRVGFITGMDFRATGGYVAAPGTLHVSGVEYRWLNGDIPDDLPDMPQSLIKDVAVEALHMGEVVETGGRDNELTRRVGRLARMGMDKDELYSTAIAINNTYIKPPLSAPQVNKIVESIYSREQRSNPKKKKEDKPSRSSFDLKTFAEMVDTYSEADNSWLVDGWLPSSTCALVTSAPGMYKTWLMMDLAVSVATGKPFLGKHKVNKTGTVIIIQQEDPFPLLVSRASTVMNPGPCEVTDDEISVPLIDPMPNILFHTTRELQFSDAEIVGLFSEEVRNRKPVLVIIDPLYSAADSDDYMASAAKDMLFLKTLRDETGTSFVITHHMNKGKSESGTRSRDKLWGSQFLNAWLETGWQLEPSQVEGCIQATTHFKLTESTPPTNLRFNISDGVFVVEEGDSVVEGGDVDLGTRIAYAIQTGRATSMSKLCEELGVKSKSTVSAALRKLGAIKGDKGYFIPEVDTD